MEQYFIMAINAKYVDAKTILTEQSSSCWRQ